MINFEKQNNTGTLVKQKRINVFNMSQEEFAERFSVPVGTLRNWEQCISQPPQYFMQLIESAETNIKRKYETPIHKVQTQILNDKDRERAALRREARRNITADENQNRIYRVLQEMIKHGGIMDNLQTISPYFNDATPSDIAAIAQLELLHDISEKLNHIEKLLEK